MLASPRSIDPSEGINFRRNLNELIILIDMHCNDTLNSVQFASNKTTSLFITRVYFLN